MEWIKLAQDRDRCRALVNAVKILSIFREVKELPASQEGLYCTQLKKKVKVKRSRYRRGVAQRVGRGIAILFHDRGTRRG